jgi:hypothetical protein
MDIAWSGNPPQEVFMPVDASAEPSAPGPIRELVIRRERFADGYSELLVKIDDKGPGWGV